MTSMHSFRWTWVSTHCQGSLQHTHTHTHTHLLNGHLSVTTRVSRHQKGKTNRVLLKQETVSGSGISWAICKSAPCSRQITTPTPHHPIFTGQMPFLPPNQQRQSTEGTKPLFTTNRQLFIEHIIGHCVSCHTKCSVHIISSCTQTQLEGGLQWLHLADNVAVQWLIAYGSSLLLRHLFNGIFSTTIWVSRYQKAYGL